MKGWSNVFFFPPSSIFLSLKVVHPLFLQSGLQTVIYDWKKRSLTLSVCSLTQACVCVCVCFPQAANTAEEEPDADSHSWGGMKGEENNPPPPVDPSNTQPRENGPYRCINYIWLSHRPGLFMLYSRSLAKVLAEDGAITRLPGFQSKMCVYTR